MATKAEIVAIIRASPLSDDDIADIISACTVITISNVLIGAGMDLLAKATVEAMDEAADTMRADVVNDDDV